MKFLVLSVLLSGWLLLFRGWGLDVLGGFFGVRSDFSSSNGLIINGLDLWGRLLVLLLLLLSLDHGLLSFELSLSFNFYLQSLEVGHPLLLFLAHLHKLIIHSAELISEPYHIFVTGLFTLILVLSDTSNGVILQALELSLTLLFSPHVELLAMESLLQVINFFQKLYILLHNPSVLSLLSLFILSEVLTQMFQVLFKVRPNRDESLLAVTFILTLALRLILHIDLVELDNTLLEFFVVCDLLEALKNIIFEALHVVILLHDSLTNILGLFGQSIEPHAEILLDQL
jgi:hypothetical protein